jgi:hypothetical protein
MSSASRVDADCVEGVANPFPITGRRHAGHGSATHRVGRGEGSVVCVLGAWVDARPDLLGEVVCRLA